MIEHLSAVHLFRDTTECPLVSVVMAVYNAEEFLSASIESIRRQTYPHWELVCWDDASTDHSWKILEAFAAADHRIQIFRDGRHRRVAGAANMALSKASGEMIARMDADDIAYPDRLEKEVAYLLAHEAAVAVGGQCALIDRSGNVIGEKLFPTNPEQCRRMMFSTLPVQQPTMLVRRSRLPPDFVWYREDATVAIEVELLFRLFQHGQVGNLPDKVLMYRVHSGNISLANPKRTFLVTLRSRIKAVFLYGYRPTLGGILATLAEVLLVALLPQRLVYPLYVWVQEKRGYGRQRRRAGQVAQSPASEHELGVSAHLPALPTPRPLDREPENNFRYRQIHRLR